MKAFALVYSSATLWYKFREKKLLKARAVRWKYGDYIFIQVMRKRVKAYWKRMKVNDRIIRSLRIKLSAWVGGLMQPAIEVKSAYSLVLHFLRFTG